MSDNITVKEIESLNARIEKLNKAKRDADAKRQVWTTQLVEHLKEYKEKYGVDLGINELSKGNMKALVKKISSEIESVKKVSEKAYTEALKVVELIEKGDIEGAKEALGVVEEDIAEEVEDLNEEDNDVLEGLDDNESDEDEVSDDVFTGGLSSAKDIVSEMEESKSSYTGGIPLDDDDDDDLVQQDYEEVEDETSTSGFEGFSLEDDEEDEDDLFGGFSDVLKGSKFE